jgi:hypothetical protein
MTEERKDAGKSLSVEDGVWIVADAVEPLKKTYNKGKPPFKRQGEIRGGRPIV